MMPPMAPRPAAAVGRGPRLGSAVWVAGELVEAVLPELVGAAVVPELEAESVVEAALLVELAAEVEAVAQVTEVGRSVTPAPLQSCARGREGNCQRNGTPDLICLRYGSKKRRLTLRATDTALSWSDALQSPARQQAISSMNSLLLQMHLTSLPQSPMPPLRKELAQLCCQGTPVSDCFLSVTITHLGEGTYSARREIEAALSDNDASESEGQSSDGLHDCGLMVYVDN